MTVRDAFKDELAMLDELEGCSEPTKQWLKEVLTNVDAEADSDSSHDLIHAVLRRIVRETLMRIYGSALWVSTDLKVLKDPKPHYSLGVIAIEKNTGVCVTWNKRTKSPYLYRDLFSVNDLVRLLMEVDLRGVCILGKEVRSDYSEAITNANRTLKELVRKYGVTVAANTDVWDILDYLCEHSDRCKTLMASAALWRGTFPDATITLSIYYNPLIGGERLMMQVQPNFSELSDATLNEDENVELGDIP
jgi:hypothetical protein